jgi:hypothetical protein
MATRKTAAAMGEAALLSPGARPALWVKLGVSLLLVLHLAAVFTAPFAAACNVRGSSSPLADSAYRVLRPYIAALFLDHGYFFFAPDPGPNHLVEYKVEFADGRPAIEGRFPNLATERPRLLYHRHFMLSESLYNAFVPPQAPPEPSPQPLTAGAEQRAEYQLQHAAHERAVADWQRRRRQYEAMWKSIEEHLLHRYGGDKVTLARIEHRPPLPDEFEVGERTLSSPDSYVKLPETAQRGGP